MRFLPPSRCASAFALLLPFALPAQPDTMTPAQRTGLVSDVLRVRVDRLHDHLRVDACSLVAATGDTSLMRHVDERVRHLLLDLPYAPGCRRPAGDGGPTCLEVASVKADSTGPVIRLLVRTGRAVIRTEEHRSRAGRWSIRIDDPPRSFQGDRVYGLEVDATTPERGEQRLRAVASAIRVLPARKDVDRAVAEEELTSQAALSTDQLLVLRSLLPEVRWFADVADARRYCEGAARTCSRVHIRSLLLTDDDWRVTLTTSSLDGCDGQEYVVTVRETPQGEEVRSIIVGANRRCRG
jgi:hypothetical protein